MVPLSGSGLGSHDPDEALRVLMAPDVRVTYAATWLGWAGKPPEQ